MADQISAKQYNLWELMGGGFIFNIPDYQRPYSWTENEALTLWDDLVEFWKDAKNDANQTYFTGSIVLVKADDSPTSEVIDGQQRLTTLSIILSILSYQSQSLQNDIKKCLWQEGVQFLKIPGSPRLSLRKRDKAFFDKYVANPNVDALIALEPAHLADDAQRLIRNNTKLLKQRIEESFSSPADIDSFITTIFGQCFFVIVTTPDNESAFRVFSVLNNRGLSLLPSDILKAKIIGAIEDANREYYTNKWEDIEVDLGREAFNSLLSHIRTVFGKNKLHGTLVGEFEKVVFPVYVDKSQIISEVIEPYAKAYREATTCSYSASSGADDVNEYLYWLNKIDDSDWVPVIMFAIVSNVVPVARMADFSKSLERLASFGYITSKTSNQRIERYCRVISALEKANVDEAFTVMALTTDEKSELTNALNGDIYLLPARKRSFVILRLDRFASDKGAKYQQSIFSIEHVLPQNPKSTSQWVKDWPAANVREYWVHKLANLVPLTRKKNSQAQNYDFQEKKKKYISDKNGVTTYVLANDVLHEAVWTPETVAKRQQRLIGIFSQCWELLDSPGAKVQEEKPETTAEKLKQQQLLAKIETFFVSHPDTKLPKLPDPSIKVGKFIQQAMHTLGTSEFILSESQIKKLCEISYSKKYTTRNLAFLVPVENAAQMDKRRYWRSESSIVTLNGKKYHVCKEWYGPEKDSSDAHLSNFLELYLDIAEGTL